MRTKAHPVCDVVASGDADSFAAELGAAIIVRWVEGREGDSSIPHGTHQTWTPELLTRELTVDASEFWFRGGGVPTVVWGDNSGVRWAATLDLGWPCDDERVVRYRIEDR